jgi:PST family polysaccharide transporter
LGNPSWHHGNQSSGNKEAKRTAADIKLAIMEINNRTYGQRLIVGSSYSYVALIINKVIAAVSSIFIARFLGPTNLGMISIVNYLFLLLMFFTGLGIPTAAVKLISEYHHQEKDKISEFIATTFILNLIIIIIVALLYYFGASYIASRVYHESKITLLIRISSLTLLFFSINQYGNAVIQAFAEFKKLSLLTIFNSVFGLLVLIPLTKLWGLKGTVISQTLASIVTFAMIFLVVNSVKIKNALSFSLGLNKLLTDSKQYLPRLFSLALPVFLSGLFMNPALMILTTFLTRSHGFNEVGYFNVAYALTQIILFVPTAVGVPFIPLATKLAVEDPKRLANFMLKTIYGAGVVVLAFSFLMSFFSHQVLTILYGTRYLSAQNILILMSVATFLASFGYIIGYYLLATGKMWLATLLNFIWFVAIIAPAYHLIKHWGAVGLGVTYLSSYIILTVIFILYLRFYLKLNVNQLILHLGIGIIFPVILFLMKLHATPTLFYICIFIVFCILFIIMIPKTIDIAVINELFKNKFTRIFSKSDIK